MLRYLNSGMLVLSIGYLVLGLLLLTMPETALLWICYAFGAVVLLTGIVCLVQYARLRGTGFSANIMLVSGVITAALGGYTLLQPKVVASFLPVVFGLFIVVDGIHRIASGVTLAKRHGRSWWALLLLGAVSVALGVYLVWRPLDLAVSVIMLCGVFLVVEGVLNLACSLYAAMELRTLDQMATAALNAGLQAAADAADEADEADTAPAAPVVCEAEAKEADESSEG